MVHRYFVLALPVHPAFELHQDGHGHIRPHFHENGLVGAAEVYRGAQVEGTAFPVGARVGDGAHFGCCRVCPAGVGIFNHLIAGPVEGAEGIVDGGDIKGNRQADRICSPADGNHFRILHGGRARPAGHHPHSKVAGFSVDVRPGFAGHDGLGHLVFSIPVVDVEHGGIIGRGCYQHLEGVCIRYRDVNRQVRRRRKGDGHHPHQLAGQAGCPHRHNAQLIGAFPVNMAQGLARAHLGGGFAFDVAEEYIEGARPHGCGGYSNRARVVLGDVKDSLDVGRGRNILQRVGDLVVVGTPGENQ